MSNKNIIFISFGYFPGFLRPWLFAVKDINVKNACTRSICIRNTCAIGINIIKHLGIHLQSFWISELRQFSTELEIKVVAG